ncbi:MAG TPA: caspase family protein, partial [Thermoanaerobaculia bacterium]|nr:caspase family protein [Thermoanaerobaculia bacterium]
MRRALGFLLALAFLEAGLLRGEDLSTEPVLRVETGMHTGKIWGMAADAAGRFVVTGSEDKTVRVWDLASGDLLRTLRPPIGPGPEGIIYDVAISSDGETVAAGGRTFNSIYLFLRSTGNVIHRIPDLPSAVQRLAFSPDNRLLAATLEGGNGIRIFRLVDGQEIWREELCKEASLISFDSAGRVVTGCTDGFLRLYDANLKPLAFTSTGWPLSIAFSPDGQEVAVRQLDGDSILLSGTDLTFIYKLQRFPIQPILSMGALPFHWSEGSLSKPAPIDTAPKPLADIIGDWGTLNNEESLYQTVAWSRDGQLLYSVGAFGVSPFRWPERGRGKPVSASANPTISIDRFIPLPGNQLAVTSKDLAWGVLTPDNFRLIYRDSDIVDFEDLRAGLLTDATGSLIQFDYLPGYTERGLETVTFSVESRELDTTPAEDLRLKPPALEWPGLSSAGRKLSLNGKPLAMSSPEEPVVHQAVAADARFLLVSTETSLRYYDHTGKELWKIRPPAFTHAVNLSGDGRVAIAAFGDGTLRWFRTADGQELLALFPHADRKRWVAWTPTGYYDASVGGEELIGWHVNRSVESAAGWFAASRFRNRFYRPAVIARILKVGDEGKALAEADAEAQAREDFQATAFSQLQPPVVTLLTPAGEVEAREEVFPFRVAVSTPKGEPVTAVRAYVDGQPVGTSRGLRFEPGNPQGKPENGDIYEISVPLPPRDCTVALVAETRFATSEPVVVKVRWAATPPVPEKPVLYLLAVGVGTYKNPDFKLDLPAKDARDIVSAWKRQEGGLYEKVKARLLTDKEATQDAILSGLEWLETQVTQKDVAVLFFAGHGTNDPRSGAYQFLPWEADLNARRTTLVPDREVINVLAGLPGKVLVFLDTCYSGNLMGGLKTRDSDDLTRLINELASSDNGIVVFAASTGRQRSVESPDWKNGVFTKAVVEALDGKADL